MKKTKKDEVRLQGLGVSPGLARARVIVRENSFVEPETYSIQESEISAERARLEHALVETRRQIVSLQNQVRGGLGGENADVFDAHLLVLEDHAVLEQVFDKVRDDLINIESAIYQVFSGYMESLRSVQDPYLKERAVDLSDVLRRVLRNLKPGEGDERSDLGVNQHHILAAHELTFSEIVSSDRSLVLAFATEMGSPTSHFSIMARSLGIPAVVGLHDFAGLFHTGDEILLDGYNGLLIAHPTEGTIRHYEEFEAGKEELRVSLSALAGEKAVTTDGHSLVLSCNIEFAHEMDRVRQIGAEGVGLYRTEFFYLNQPLLPEEEALSEDYGRVAGESAPHGVIIRTLDAGGDKLPGNLDHGPEPNPFLGWRGIRVCLRERNLFQTQLRAILRASAQGKVSVMFPLVSSAEELRAAKAGLEEAKQTLRDEGIPFDEEIQVGVMIEVPSAAIIADVLATEVDFFSIGTNDLVQYTIAVDRVNEWVADLYAPLHPAIVRLIYSISQVAQKHGIWAGVCGEMAGDILSTPVLVGAGITELSVGPGQLLAVKRAIRTLDRGECEALAQEAITLATTGEIASLCREMAERCYPELLE